MRIKVKKIIILFLIYLSWVCIETAYAQASNIRVKGKTKAETLTFSGNRTAYPQSPVEGELFYNSAEKAVKYYNGSGWVSPGSGATGKCSGTRVVAAYNSIGSVRTGTTDPCPGNGGDCSNPHADYTCDGTNDEQFIQQAINSLVDSAGNPIAGVVQLLEGTYKISNPINFNTTAPNDSGVSIAGSGAATVLKKASGGGNIIYASGVGELTIARLSIDGSSLGGCGISFDNINDSTIEDVSVKDFSDANIYLNNSANCRVVGCQLQGAAWKMRVMGSSNNIIMGNTVYGLGGGLYLGAGSDNNVVCDNNLPDGSNVQGIYVKSAENNIIVNNNISQKAQGVYLDGYAGDCQGNIVSENSIDRSGQFGLACNTASYNVIYANNLSSNYLGMAIYESSSNNIIGSNLIVDDTATGTAGTYPAIRLDMACRTNLIVSNRIYGDIVVPDANVYGILINTLNSSGNYLAANFINGLRYTHKIRDYGDETRYFDKMKVSLDPRSITQAGPAFTKPVSYLSMDKNGDIGNLNIGSGYAPGAILVLEVSKSFGRMYIQRLIGSGSNTIYGVFDDPETWNWNMRQFDTITLMWNGVKWVELHRSRNYVEPAP